MTAFVDASREVFGNASSVHRDGQMARQRLESARRSIAGRVGRGPKELVFTGGGTESNNLAVLGVVRAVKAGRRHVVTSRIEHPAVLAACAVLEREGVEIGYARPNSAGVIEPDEVRALLRPETVLVSVMHANNETGVIQPVAEIARAARETGARMHSDGVQLGGRLPVDLEALGVDLYAIGGHKFGGPKGVGALYVRDGVEIEPLLVGGRHERSRRAGTENVPGAAAMAAAFEEFDWTSLAPLRNRLATALGAMPGVSINGAGAERLPNTVNATFEGVDGEAMVIALDLRGFAVSSGSACSSGAVEPSHVLLAMGLSPANARSSVRFSLGPGTSEQDVDALAEAATVAFAHLLRLSPTYA